MRTHEEMAIAGASGQPRSKQWADEFFSAITVRPNEYLPLKAGAAKAACRRSFSSRAARVPSSPARSSLLPHDAPPHGVQSPPWPPGSLPDGSRGASVRQERQPRRPPRHQLFDLGLQLRLEPVGILPAQRLVPAGVGLNLGDCSQLQKPHRSGHHQDLDKQIL